jgi:hypothetical protein
MILKAMPTKCLPTGKNPYQDRGAEFANLEF